MFNENVELQDQELISSKLTKQILKLAFLVRNEEIEELKYKSKEALTTLKSLMNSNEPQMIKQKLSNDLNNILLQIKKVQQEVERKKEKKFKQNFHENPELNEENTPLLQVQYDQELEQPIQINEQIIEERDQELIGLQTSVQEVNEIFRDLGALVNSQQFLLDNIEQNVNSVSINMQNAAGELNSARRYQDNRSKCMWYVFIVLLIITVFSVLLLRPWRIFH